MAEPTQRRRSSGRRHRKKRFRSWKRVSVILIVVGLTGMALGGLLLVAWAVTRNAEQAKLGLIYVAASLVVLGAQRFVAYLDVSRKRHYKKSSSRQQSRDASTRVGD